jgi:hypothetical protein
MVDWMIQSRLLNSDRNMECVIAGLREDGDINSPMIMEFCDNLPQWDGHVFGRLASAMFQAEKWVACQLSKI